MVPEITAVSKPNSKPPRAATTVLFKSDAFSFMLASFVRNWLTNADGIKTGSIRACSAGGWF